MNLLGQKITLRRILGMIAGVVIIGIGIAGMYLAPFGMLISKWAALKAFRSASRMC